MAFSEADLQGWSDGKLAFVVENRPDTPLGRALGEAAAALLDRRQRGEVGPIPTPQQASHAKNLEQAGIEQTAAEARYGEAKAAQEPGGFIGSTPSPYAPPGAPPIRLDRSMEEAVGKQALGTAAAGAELVPGVEAVTTGAAGRPILEETVQKSPSPFVSRGGSMLGLYLAARGAGGAGAKKLVEIAAKPYSAPYKETLEFAAKAAPRQQFLPHLAAGGASAAAVAGGEAALKRGAQLATGKEVEPVQSAEILVPAAFGTGIATLPGLAAAFRNPMTEGGQITQRYANAYKSGTARDVAEEEMRNPIEGKMLPAPLERAQREADVSLGKAALGTEPQFSTAHHAAERGWMDKQFGPRFAEVQLQTAGRTTNPKATIDALRELAATKASQSALKEEGRQLGLGTAIEGLAAKLEPYLGPGATVRDYKNVIDEVTSLAQKSRPSKVAEQLYGEAEDIVRRDAYAAFPEYKALAEEHKAFQKNQEAMSGMVYGKETHQAEDYTGATPEARGRKFFKSLASGAPEAEAAAEELSGRAPYGRTAVEQMRQAEAKATKRFGERQALDVSRFRPLSEWAHGAALMGAAPAASAPHAASMGVRGATSTFPKLIQPIRSKVARRLPRTESLETAAPQIMLLIPAASGPAAFEDIDLDLIRKRISER